MDRENKLLITTKGQDIYFKALGHVTANLCFPLRDMIIKRISSFDTPFNIYFDLSETKYMDSTFLGILVSLEKKIFSIFTKHLFILNPNEISMKLLKNMGLDRFLKISISEADSSLTYDVFDEETMTDEIEKCRIVLASHKELSSISEENRKKFESLQQILEEQLKN